MRKLLLGLTAFLFFTGTLLAQKTITGKVTDDKQNPVPNASVVVKGTTTGTTTKADGTYSLTVPADATTLQFSSVGMEPKEVAIGNQSIINVDVKPADVALSEVVVTAYGATQKKSFTGTASTIKSEAFKDLQVSTLTGVLQGNASGVLAVNSNGQPGENPTIRIRGIGSIGASSAPLILVDGAPYGGSINSLNPSDIESITVLKDASSTSLYGSRAANGILQITTKMGRGKPKVSVSAINGFSDRAVNDYKYTSSQQLYELTWEALRNEAKINPTLVAASGSASAEDYASKTVVGTLVYNPFGLAQPVGVDGKIKSDVKNLWNEDWSDALLQTGVRQDYNLSISGGNDRTRYYFSGGYLKDEGIAKQSEFQRYTGRLKVDTKVNDWLTAGVNTNIAYSTQNYPVQGGSAYSNVIGWIRTVSPIYPVYLRDPATGSFLLDINGQQQYDFGDNGPLRRPLLTPGNPAGTTEMNPTTYDRYVTSVNGFGEAEVARGVKLRTQYSIDLYQGNQNTYYNPFVGDGAAYNGRSFKSRGNTTTQTWTNTVTYDKKFADIHHINFVGGMEAYRYHDGTVSAEARGFTFPGTTELAYGSIPYTASSVAYDNRMVSYFGRLNYDLSDKYHISASLRRDGSSRFADSTRWGTFWSVGGAWNLSSENFLKNNRIVSSLKLRASYGTSGNQALTGYFPYLGTYETGWNIADYPGSIINKLSNGNLGWETQQITDLGIDFGFLKERITGSVTYFIRNSADLLFDRPLVPSQSPVPTITANIGKVQNKGIEIDLTTVNIRNRDFTWRTTFNITQVKNEIKELPQKEIAGAGLSNLKVGESLYNIYIREYAGVDAADGRPMWYMDQTDASGKVTKIVTKTWSAATRYYLGTTLPDWSGGMTNYFNYKGFDLTILAAFNIGGKIYDADYAGLMHSSTGVSPGSNWTTDVLGRWQSPSNPGDGRTPRLTATTDDQATSTSTRFLYDGGYIRIRNITLGYNLPQSLMERAHISNARIFVDAQNPVTIFGREGLDPEAGLTGVTSNTSSAYRTIAVGINIGL